MWPILVELGFWFWASAAVACAILFYAVEIGAAVWATVSLFLFLGYMQWFTEVKPLVYLKEDPGKLCVILLTYFFVGLTWSIVKWWFYVKRAQLDYVKRKRKWLDSRGFHEATTVPEHLRENWKNDFGHVNYYDFSKGIPKASANRTRIVGWMCYWPWSMIASLFNDVVRWLFEWCYELFSGIFLKIERKARIEVEMDMPREGDINGSKKE